MLLLSREAFVFSDQSWVLSDFLVDQITLEVFFFYLFLFSHFFSKGWFLVPFVFDIVNLCVCCVCCVFMKDIVLRRQKGFHLPDMIVKYYAVEMLRIVRLVHQLGLKKCSICYISLSLCFFLQTTCKSVQRRKKKKNKLCIASLCYVFFERWNKKRFFFAHCVFKNNYRITVIFVFTGVIHGNITASSFFIRLGSQNCG